MYPTQESIRELVRSSIKEHSLAQVDEAFSVSKVGGLRSGVKYGTGASIFAGLLTGGMGGSFMASAAVTAASLATVAAGTFASVRMLQNIPALRNRAFNKQVADKFDRLVSLVENRDQYLVQMKRLTSVSERNKFMSRNKSPMGRLTKEIARLSSELRDDVLELGDDLDMNDYDRQNLMSILDKGAEGAVSNVLNDRRKAEEIVRSTEEAA